MTSAAKKIAFSPGLAWGGPDGDPAYTIAGMADTATTAVVIRTRADLRTTDLLGLDAG